MTKTIIRPATPADFPVLLQMDAACFPEGIAYESEELDWFMKRKGAETIVLEQSGEIAAFLIVEIDPKSHAATVVTLDVREDCRRLGFGSKLLQRSEEIVVERNAKDFRLQVDVNNGGAITFYERHGFLKARRLARYYSDGHDAWLMVKVLPQIADTSR